MRSYRHLLLGLAILVYGLFRAWVLHANFDTLCLPNYELTISGNVGYMGASGWRGPALHQYYDNCGGHLVTGLLAAPLFWLLGPSYLVLKLVPVLLGLASLVLIWRILEGRAGLWAATIAVLLFAVGPPTLAKYSMLAKGNHYENLFFQLLCLWIFLRLHESESKRPWVLAFGLAAGFATFFYFGSLALIGALTLTHLMIRRPKLALRDFAQASLSFVVGLLPLFWVEWNSGSRPAAFLKAKFAAQESKIEGSFFSRIQEFITEVLPKAGVFEDLGPLPARLGEWLWLLGFVAAWLVLAQDMVSRLLRGREESATSEKSRCLNFAHLPYLLYLPLVMIVVGTSTFEFKAYGPPVEVGQYRYLVPHFMLSAMMVGKASHLLWHKRDRLLRPCGALLALASLTSTLFTLPIASEDIAQPGLGQAYNGYALRYFNNVLLRDFQLDEATGRLTWDHPWVEAEIEEFAHVERHELWFGIGFHLAAAQTMERKTAKTPPHFDLDALCAPYPDFAHPDLARGAGSHLRVVAALGKSGKDLVDRSLAELSAQAHELFPWVAEGLAITFEYPLARLSNIRLNRTRSLLESLPEPVAQRVWRGFGLEAGFLAARGIAGDRKVLAEQMTRVPAAALPEVFFGFGMALAADSALRNEPPNFERIPTTQRAVALLGAGAGWRHALGADLAEQKWQEWAKGCSSEELALVKQGVEWPNYPALLPISE